MPEELTKVLEELGLVGNKAQVGEQAWQQILVGEDHAEGFPEYFDEEELEELDVEEDTLIKAFQALLDGRRKQLDKLSADERTTSLTRAFDELEEQGIIARQNFSCCGTCAPGEIQEERKGGNPSRGYVYYHMQDAEQLVEDRSTMLGYGAFVDSYFEEEDWLALSDAKKDSEYERIALELMNSVVLPTLQRHGIEVSWEGSLDRRIGLSNVDYIADV